MAEGGRQSFDDDDDDEEDDAFPSPGIPAAIQYREDEDDDDDDDDEDARDGCEDDSVANFYPFPSSCPFFLATIESKATIKSALRLKIFYYESVCKRRNHEIVSLGYISWQRYRPTRSLAEFVLRRTIEFLAPLSSPIPYRFQGARGGAESRRKRNEWRPDGKEKTSRNGENVAGKKRKGWYKSTRPSSLLLSETGSSIDSPEVTAIEDFSIVASHEYSDKRNRSKVGPRERERERERSYFAKPTLEFTIIAETTSWLERYPSNAKSKPQSDFDEIWKATRDGRDRLLSTFFPIDTWTSTSLGIRASEKRFWGKFGDVA
ncbi:hypothetical protein V1477_002528 [Vespula maculifrons]|uniref:Uncharacterized protein n=1 Tax=Vespula maculifrons TaxID=7453 RepID=A0ABD2CWR3_VESMC